MQEPIPIPAQSPSEPEDDLGPAPLPQITTRRAIPVVIILTVIVLLALLPPLLNVNRYKRQIVTSISTSLGRPVHIDSVSLNLLPLPSFTLTNFVISEDPAFGAEPVLLANEVRATLRVSSLWHRPVEFSRIALDTPSVNLVHLPDGRWNLESILIQASRMPAAPTTQKTAGPAQRFPYIEATSARVNLKMGLEKLPLSLTDSDFALWLPEPNEWHLRLKAHPTRTDAPPTDTGLLRVEGTLGHAATLSEVPIDLHGEWRTAPLGAMSWILLAHDAGLRGEMDLYANLRGTMGRNNLETRLSLQRVRRADFVPDQPLDAEIACKAQVVNVFHALHQVQCAWPETTPDQKDSGTASLLLTGDLPDIRHPELSQATATLSAIPAATLLNVLRVASHRASPELKATGTLSGTFAYNTEGTDSIPVPKPTPKQKNSLPATPQLPSFTIAKASLALANEKPFFDQDITATIAGGQLAFSPITLALAPPTSREQSILEIRATPAGYTLHLAGTVLPARLLQLAQTLPEFGDGIETFLPPPTPTQTATPDQTQPTTKTSPSPTLSHPDPLTHIDLLSTRTWPTRQIWTLATPPPHPDPPQTPPLTEAPHRFKD